MFRPIKIYKYLDKARFEVDFITHGASSRFERAVLDDSLLAEVQPAPAVHRVRTIIPHDLLPALRARLRRGRRGDRVAAPAASTTQAPAPRTERLPQRGLAGTLYRWFALAVYFPDHLFLWGWFAAFKAALLHARRRYGLVYTTSFPESAHLAGLVLNVLGVPWVVDYRYGGPLWIKEVTGFRKPSVRERIDHAYQRLVLRRADQVVTQSAQIRADFCRVFGLDPNRVVVIPSGFDEADFDAAGAPAPFSKADAEVHLLHMGTLEGLAEREHGQLLEAIDELGGQLRDRGRSLILHAVGSDLLGPNGRRKSIAVDYHHHGIVVHRDIPSYLMAADCCLLSTWTTSNGSVQGFIPSKLWEYLRCGRPILTTGPRDEVWTIVKDAGVGLRLELNGHRAANAGLADDLVRRLTARQPPAAAVQRYSWESRARALQNVFLQMVEGPEPHPAEENA